MTGSGLTSSSPLLQRLTTALRERLRRLHDLQGRLLRLPEPDGRDLRDLYLNP
jgi:hypothetical protein